MTYHLIIKKFFKGIHHHYYIIFAAALIIRFIFLLAVISQVESMRLNSIFPDVVDYVFAAEQIKNSFDFNSTAVLLFGPGYPILLAMQRIVFGTNPIVLIVVQIIISSLAAALLAAFAFRLTGDRRVSLAAGLLNALSFMSISLSCTLLSETCFFCLMLIGLIIFQKGLDTNRIIFFAVAGMIFGAAALVRTVAQFFFVIILLMAICSRWFSEKKEANSVLRILKFPLITALTMMLMVGAWSARNYFIHGFTQPALAGYGGMKALTILTHADVNGTRFDIEHEKYFKDLERAGGADRQYGQAFIRFVKEAFYGTARNHPGTMLKAFIGNAVANSNTDWGIHYDMFPDDTPTLRGITSWMEKKGLNYRVSLLFLIGLVLLWRKRNYRVAIITAGIYLYFAFFSGFSVGQGGRIFYPAETAWTIPAAVVIIHFVTFLKNLLKPGNKSDN